MSCMYTYRRVSDTDYGQVNKRYSVRVWRKIINNISVTTFSPWTVNCLGLSLLIVLWFLFWTCSLVNCKLPSLSDLLYVAVCRIYYEPDGTLSGHHNAPMSTTVAASMAPPQEESALSLLVLLVHHTQYPAHRSTHSPPLIQCVRSLHPLIQHTLPMATDVPISTNQEYEVAQCQSGSDTPTYDYIINN